MCWTWQVVQDGHPRAFDVAVSKQFMDECSYFLVLGWYVRHVQYAVVLLQHTLEFLQHLSVALHERTAFQEEDEADVAVCLPVFLKDLFQPAPCQCRLA